MKYTLQHAAPQHDFAAELNGEQYAAVCSESRHALVIAGAGSGKTRTLTYRVAYLLQRGVAPWRILLLTFTNKAAREMQQRVAQLTGENAERIWGGTFHSIANRILRRHCERLGYRPAFSILDSDDQKALMRALVKEVAGKSSKSDRFPKAELLLNLHSFAANSCEDWLDVLYRDYPQLEKHIDSIRRIYESYAARKLESNAMDFDDLLCQLLRLLEENPDLLEDYSGRFLHVLVDEYQDTNALQDRLIRLLASGREGQLMVVGDDAQSIYAWRGADVQNIFDFPKRYPDCEIFKIETNYRSVPSILALSNAAIAQNECQYQKTLRAARPEGAMKPAVVPAPDNHSEALFVAQRIDELMAGGIAGKDIAVLYRAHFHSLDVQMELMRQHIPFRITSGLRFFEQAHVKDVLAYLRLFSNPRDLVAFRRIVGAFPRVGEATAAKLATQWLERLESYMSEHPDCPSTDLPLLELMGKLKLSPAIRPQWESFLQLMESLHPQGKLLSPPELISAVLKHIEPQLRREYENFDEREEDLQQLARSLGNSENLEDFLSQIALLSEVDKEEAIDNDCVTLSSIHQAKGLEWKVVFIIFLSDGLFPHYRVLESGDSKGMEEETRLFYVAITRAEDQLYLSFPRYNGRDFDRRYCPPSRFLSQLPPDLLELWEI